MTNTSNTLSNTYSLVSLNHRESALWKLNPHKVVEHILISSDKRVNVRKSVEK